MIGKKNDLMPWSAVGTKQCIDMEQKGEGGLTVMHWLLHYISVFSGFWKYNDDR